MNIALWAIQALLALAYVLAGFPKATQPIATVAKRIAWVSAAPAPFVRFIGIVELLAAIGLILPLATGILPWLTVAAAAGLVIVQVGAVIFHAARRETNVIPMNVVLLLLALLVVVGRVAFIPVA